MNNKQFRKLVADLTLAGEVATPRCPHAEQCGGCAFQHRAYADQVAAKSTALTRLWHEADPEGLILAPGTVIDVVAADEPFAYRTRMDYVATKGRFGLRARGKFNYIVELETCHLIPPEAFAAALAVWQRAGELGLPDYNIRSHEGFLRYIVVRRSPANELLLAAVTAAGPYEAEMEQLAQTALGQPGVLSFHWLLNDSLTDLSFGAPLRHWGAETLLMRAGDALLEVGPNTFFQNNVHLLDRLLGDVREAVGAQGAMADLYGGVGTIALHLAHGVGQIVCVESVAESAVLAERNIGRNGAKNIAVHAVDVIDFLREQAPARFDCIVADPPRTGLGPAVSSELLRLEPRKIVYVSCNPLTQIDDLRILNSRYELRSLRGYDMFPQTPHLEALAVLELR